jgi:hypothetical protein
VVSREFLYRLEDELTRKLHEINERNMGIQELREALNGPDLEISYQEFEGGNQLYMINGNEIWTRRGLPIEAVVSEYLNPTKVSQVTTPLDRLKGKFLQARGVAQRVAGNMEAEADSLIAEEDKMKAKTVSAFAPHKAILAEASSELKAIEDALNLMSNGGPVLDPLPESASTESGS